MTTVTIIATIGIILMSVAWIRFIWFLLHEDFTLGLAVLGFTLFFIALVMAAAIDYRSVHTLGR